MLGEFGFSLVLTAPGEVGGEGRVGVFCSKKSTGLETYPLAFFPSFPVLTLL